MHWRDSWTHGIRELVTDAPTRQQERVLGHIKMERGHITGFVPNGCCHERIVANADHYDNFGTCRPERYKEVERKVEEAVREQGQGIG